jgi:hypothetical protein
MGVPRFGAHAMRPYVARRSGSGATVRHLTTKWGMVELWVEIQMKYYPKEVLSEN